jgi:Glycosyltransferase family 87
LESASSHRLKPRTVLLLLAADGGVMLLAFWVLVSLALEPHTELVFNVKGARYGGPLTWPAKWFNLNSLSAVGRSNLFIALMLLLTFTYLVAIFLVRRDNRRSVTLVLSGFFVLFVVLFLFIPPFLSRDVYSYTFYGRVMSVYHGNPYLMIPANRPHDVFSPLIGWKYNASVYGPVFNWLSFWTTRFAGNNIPLNVFAFKALAAAFYAGCLPIIYILTRRVSPGRENFALAVSAWCPIVLIHICGGGHNDSLVAFFVLAGFLLYRKERAYLGLLVVTVAVMIKLTAVLALAPYVILYVRDKRGRPLQRLAAAACGMSLVAAVSYLPFWKGMKTFEGLRRVSQIYSLSSVPQLVSLQVQKVLIKTGMSGVKAESLASSWVHLAFLAIFALATLFFLTRVKDYRSMIIATAAITLVWFLTSTYILPWYLVTGLMVACVTGWNYTTAAYLAVGGFFTMYHLPSAITPRLPGTHRLGTDLYLSLPFLLILLIWMVLVVFFWLDPENRRFSEVTGWRR